MHSRSLVARILASIVGCQFNLAYKCRQGGKDEIGAVPENGKAWDGYDKAEIPAKPDAVLRVASQLPEGPACSAMFASLFANWAWAC